MRDIKKSIGDELRMIVANGEFVDFANQLRTCEPVIGEFPESVNQRQPVRYEWEIGELNNHERALCTLLNCYHETLHNSGGVDTDQIKKVLESFICAREMLFESIRIRYRHKKETVKDGMTLGISKGFKVVLRHGICTAFRNVAENMFRQYATFRSPFE